jgi:hypothetical protein
MVSSRAHEPAAPLVDAIPISVPRVDVGIVIITVISRQHAVAVPVFGDCPKSGVGVVTVAVGIQGDVPKACVVIVAVISGEAAVTVSVLRYCAQGCIAVITVIGGQHAIAVGIQGDVSQVGVVVVAVVLFCETVPVRIRSFIPRTSTPKPNKRTHHQQQP